MSLWIRTVALPPFLESIAKSPFLEGIARILDLGNTLDDSVTLVPPHVEVALALMADWKTIGMDLSRVLVTFSDEEKIVLGEVLLREARARLNKGLLDSGLELGREVHEVASARPQLTASNQ